MTKKLVIALMLLAIALTLSACGPQPEKPAAPATEAPASVVEFSVQDANKVILDKDGIKITFIGMEKDNYNYTLKLAYENTTDKKYEVQLRNSKVDGKEDLTVCSDTLEAKSSSEGGIQIPVNGLSNAGVTEPGTLEADVVVIYDILENVATVPVKISLK